MSRFAGQSALVTGAASGIGRAVARRLAAEGATVVGVDLDAVGLEETFASLPDARAVVADIADVAGGEDGTGGGADGGEVLALAAAADVLVNAAGVLERHDFLAHPLAAWQRTLAVNLLAPQRLSRAFARARVGGDAVGAEAGATGGVGGAVSGGAVGGGGGVGTEAGATGSIVNVCSIESFVALPGHAAYTASKSALLLLTRAFALELAPHGVRVNAVAPGVTTTGMNAALCADGAQAAALRERIPLGRFATPEEQAAGICFLASPEASFITGATLPVDGGWLTQ
jgi:NAD(P)-dependent dehydrogenase (short-subunit alcohol dehydrogenase family)